MDGANNPGLHAHNQPALKRAFCVWLGDFPESNLPFDKFVWNEFGQRVALAPERKARRGESHGWGRTILGRNGN